MLLYAANASVHIKKSKGLGLDEGLINQICESNDFTEERLAPLKKGLGPIFGLLFPMAIRRRSGDSPQQIGPCARNR